MMKRLFFAAMLALAISAAAQTPTVTTPQSVTTANVLNAATAATTTSCLSNLGQTVHFLFFRGTGGTGTPSGVRLRLEASFNSDAATCTTGTWAAISDDGTDPTSGNVSVVLGIGSFPFLRVNLISCGGCSSSSSVTADYTGTSSIPGNPFGSYGAGQQIRKVLFTQISDDVNNQTSSTIITPYGSAAGFILINATGNLGGSRVLTVRNRDFQIAGTLTLFQQTLPSTGPNNFIIPIPPTSTNTIDVKFGDLGSSTGQTLSAWYFFFPPGEAQPPSVQPGGWVTASSNGEFTAAANTAVVVTLTPNSFQRANLFLVNARCSAGTAQLTVADGSSTIYSTAATEVGTTSFFKQFNPALPSGLGGNLVITLGTCGPANIGTLDVQASVF